MDMGDVFELAARQAAEKHPRDSIPASEELEEPEPDLDLGEEMAEDVVQPLSPPRNRAVRG